MDQPYEQSKLQQAKERWEAERLDPALAKVSRPRMPSDVKQQRLYTPLAGAISLHPWRPALHVSGPFVDHAPVRRLWHAGGNPRTL